MTRSILTAALVSALSLAGCNRAAPDAATTAAAASDKASPTPANALATPAKFEAYTAAYNDLIEKNWGVRANFDDHRERDLAKADPADDLTLPENISTLERAVEKLKAGRAANGDAAESREADAAADAVLPAATALLAQWKELKPYFDTRAYRADKLAKYKAASASLTANYEATLAGIDKLDAALTVQQRAMTLKRAEGFKAAGNMPLYHAANTLYLAELFVSAAMAGKTAEADAALPKLEASSAALGAAAASTPATDENHNNLGWIHDKVNSMIGNYRDYQQSHDDRDLESVVSDYNDAIGDYADLELPAN